MRSPEENLAKLQNYELPLVNQNVSQKHRCQLTAIIYELISLVLAGGKVLVHFHQIKEFPVLCFRKDYYASSFDVCKEGIQE